LVVCIDSLSYLCYDLLYQIFGSDTWRARMTIDKFRGLSRREREIMEILHRTGKASPDQVQESLPSPPSYTAVNTMLRILMDHGHIDRTLEGRQYVYFPIQPRQTAARSALQQVIETFFSGSVEQAVTTLLSDEETHFSEDQLARLAGLIEEARMSEEGDGEPQ